MNSRLTKFTGRLVLIILAAALTMTYFTVTAGYAGEIDINPSPYVININDNMYTFVIHTNIPCSRVADRDAVTVNGVPVYYWKMDSLGYYDAIVRVEDLDLAAGGLNTLLLVGTDIDGNEFFGIEEIWVIDKGTGLGKLLK